MAVDTSAALLTDTTTGLKLEQFNNTRKVGYTRFGVADYTFNYTIPTNVWMHLVYVGTTTGVSIHTNGVFAATNNVSITLPRNWLGAWSSGATDHFKGQLDEITLFNRDLTVAEIVQLYTNIVP